LHAAQTGVPDSAPRILPQAFPLIAENRVGSLLFRFLQFESNELNHTDGSFNQKNETFATFLIQSC
jgi:hypothetical protein